MYIYIYIHIYNVCIYILSFKAIDILVCIKWLSIYDLNCKVALLERILTTLV